MNHVKNYLTEGNIQQKEAAMWFLTCMASGPGVSTLAEDWEIDVITQFATIYNAAPIKEDLLGLCIDCI